MSLSGENKIPRCLSPERMSFFCGCVKCLQPPHRAPHKKKKKNCDRQRWQKYIYFVLKVIRTTFTPSCQGVIRPLVLHSSPLVGKLWCLPSWCSGLSVTSQQEAWVPILMKSIFHILKEKHTCFLWALSPKNRHVSLIGNPQFSIGIVSLSV